MGQVQTCLEHGFSLIPIKPSDKRPVIRWERAQEERAPEDMVRDWWRRGFNLAVVTGSLSGVVVVDCDSLAGSVAAIRKGLPETPTATTGKGRHYYFKHPGVPIRNAVRLLPDVDIRGDGGYVVIPPSKHPSGSTYRWLEGLSLADVPLAPLPEWVVEASRVQESEARPTEDWRELTSGTVEPGQRNQKLAELAGYLLRKRVDVEVTLNLMQAWNRAVCAPPMPPREVERTTRSIAAREERRRG